jgi:hypothetical protein
MTAEVTGSAHVPTGGTDPCRNKDRHVFDQDPLSWRACDHIREKYSTIRDHGDTDGPEPRPGLTENEVAHVPAEAQAVLASFDKRSAHYEVLDHRDQPP